MRRGRQSPNRMESEQATRFVLELDLEHLTEDELNYLHKLRTMAQRKIIEAYQKKRTS